MSDTTLIPKPTSKPPKDDAGEKKYSDSAIRSAYGKLLKSFKDPERTVLLVAKSSKLAPEAIRRIVGLEPPPPAEDAEAKKDKTKKLTAPDPPAMLAFRHFALRDQSVNATVLTVVRTAKEHLGQAREMLELHGFKSLPLYDNQNEYQRAVMNYVGKVLHADPDLLAAGVRNENVEGAEDKVGRTSSMGVPLDTEMFAELVAPIKEAAQERFADSEVHYISLPPLDIRKITHSSHTIILTKSPVAPDTSTIPLVTADFLRARSRDLVFVDWVAQNYPKGAKLEDLAPKIEFADWLISLLSYTMYPSHKIEGKQMLVRLACVCAARAHRFAPSASLRHFLAAAERWVDDPSEENRVLADHAKDELRKPIPGEDTAFTGPAAYAYQAAKEATMRAVAAAGAGDPTRVSSHVARAAAAAVMAATFAGNKDATSSWLNMVGSRTGTDESKEQKEICDAIRSVIHLK